MCVLNFSQVQPITVSFISLFSKLLIHISQKIKLLSYHKPKITMVVGEKHKIYYRDNYSHFPEPNIYFQGPHSTVYTPCL